MKHPAQPRVHIEYTQFKLENGLNVLVHADDSLPIVAVNVWYHVGSKNERPGRTGFAHLFEHLMFEGSENVPEGLFDELLEGSGGINNGSTDSDRTNYWETVPTAALERALWLEADRMGWLLQTMDQEKLDAQRSVVMNERRESYENRPYGMAWETILKAVYPEGHPYRWPTIGSMEDLERATLDDVRDFFRTFYHPRNASLAIAGAVSIDRVRAWVELYFGDIPAGAPIPSIDVPPVHIALEGREILEDDVELARLELVWVAPASFADGDAEASLAAEVLAGGKSSRLYQQLVVEAELAEDVDAFFEEGELGGLFVIEVTALPGVPLSTLDHLIHEEIARLASSGPTADEVQRALAQTEAGFVRSLERVGGFDGKADRLNYYHFTAGDAGFIGRDLERYQAVDVESLRCWVDLTLAEPHAFGLSVVPRGKTEWGANAPEPPAPFDVNGGEG